MLKLLEVNKFYPPHIGGIETLIAQRADYFSHRPDVQVKVLVCQERGHGVRERVGDVEVLRAGSFGTVCSSPVSLDFFRQFRKMAAWADVIEIHTPFPPGDLACLLFAGDKRVVIAWHSDVVRQKKLLAVYRPLLHAFLRRADVIITATPGHIRSSAFLPPFREKCRIIPYPLAREHYHSKPSAPVLHPDDPKACKLLFVGRLVYYKGADVLVRAMRHVRGCELFLCGTGVLEERLRQMAEGLPVHFMGQPDDAMLREMFADCDIFVLPSVENSEAFGIVQQEAMACGKPVINTALPTGVPFVSIHRQTGLTVPPGDVKALARAIQILTDRPGLRHAMGNNARHRVETAFDYETNMRRIFGVLKGES